MKVYEDIESKMTVEFTKTHVGHGIDLGRVKITREEKEDIAKKLENKILVEAILDDIRNSINQKLERIHLITRQDIKNIREEYNISSDGILNSNDVVSVNKWVEGLKNREESPIVLFKDQNIFDENLYPDRSWRRSIARLITKKEMQVEAYKIVRSLLVETDEAAFDIMLKEALKMKWYGINTNMHIESMHRTIKHVYPQGKKVKRLDKALFSLMKFVRDRVFDRLISLEKGKVSSKISQLRKRHKVGRSLTSLCIENNEDEWSVSSTRESMMLGMAKVVFSILLSGMTAIGRVMESGRRGYGSSSGWKVFEFFGLAES
ncbi:uncharacterized protein TNCV_927751 [Trichonephila clavipes]|nr:uncharacterized protein TNCV_927751 [Trichonephila clavipes]